MPDRTATALLASALEYASRGWAVFPILPGLFPGSDQSADQQQPESRPPDWEQWATTDNTRISRIWEQHSWGIAISCRASNLLVIESALTESNLMPGETYLCDLASQHGSLPGTWTVAAPDGTLVRYFQHPAWAINTDALGLHLRIRTHGHYTIAPPTTTSEGTWQLLQNLPVAPLPQWLAHILTTGLDEQNCQ